MVDVLKRFLKRFFLDSIWLEWVSSQSECEVMAGAVVGAWMEDKVLLSRGGFGQLCQTANNKCLTRADVVANAAILGPILEHMGAKLSVDTLTTVVDDFFNRARPRGKKTVSRSLFELSKQNLIHRWYFATWSPNCITDQLVFSCGFISISGSTAKGQAWIIKRLISIFTRSAARGHYPREPGMRAIFVSAGIELPSDPRSFAFIACHMFGFGCRT